MSAARAAPSIEHARSRWCPSSGRTLLKTSIMPLMQVGPTVHTIQSGLCQWYDDYDKWHLMEAAMGMGYCDANHGPSRCVLDHYLDAYGCLTDVIQSTQLVHAGWGQWATQVNQKKRFAYEDGKRDYTDCFVKCESSGFTFKTDTTQGYGFTATVIGMVTRGIHSQSHLRR